LAKKNVSLSANLARIKNNTLLLFDALVISCHSRFRGYDKHGCYYYFTVPFSL